VKAFLGSVVVHSKEPVLNLMVSIPYLTSYTCNSSPERVAISYHGNETRTQNLLFESHSPNCQDLSRRIDLQRRDSTSFAISKILFGPRLKIHTWKFGTEV
jgi:hypothetical protein